MKAAPARSEQQRTRSRNAALNLKPGDIILAASFCETELKVLRTQSSSTGLFVKVTPTARGVPLSDNLFNAEDYDFRVVMTAAQLSDQPGFAVEPKDAITTAIPALPDPAAPVPAAPVPAAPVPAAPVPAAPFPAAPLAAVPFSDAQFTAVPVTAALVPVATVRAAPVPAVLETDEVAEEFKSEETTSPSVDVTDQWDTMLHIDLSSVPSGTRIKGIIQYGCTQADSNEAWGRPCVATCEIARVDDMTSYQLWEIKWVGGNFTTYACGPGFDPYEVLPQLERGSGILEASTRPRSTGATDRRSSSTEYRPRNMMKGQTFYELIRQQQGESDAGDLFSWIRFGRKRNNFDVRDPSALSLLKKQHATLKDSVMLSFRDTTFVPEAIGTVVDRKAGTLRNSPEASVITLKGLSLSQCQGLESVQIVLLHGIIPTKTVAGASDLSIIHQERSARDGVFAGEFRYMNTGEEVWVFIVGTAVDGTKLPFTHVAGVVGLQPPFKAAIVSAVSILAYQEESFVRLDSSTIRVTPEEYAALTESAVKFMSKPIKDDDDLYQATRTTTGALAYARAFMRNVKNGRPSKAALTEEKSFYRPTKPAINSVSTAEFLDSQKKRKAKPQVVDSPPVVPSRKKPKPDAGLLDLTTDPPQHDSWLESLPKYAPQPPQPQVNYPPAAPTVTVAEHEALMKAATLQAKYDSLVDRSAYQEKVLESQVVVERAFRAEVSNMQTGHVSLLLSRDDKMRQAEYENTRFLMGFAANVARGMPLDSSHSACASSALIGNDSGSASALLVEASAFEAKAAELKKIAMTMQEGSIKSATLQRSSQYEQQARLKAARALDDF